MLDVCRNCECTSLETMADALALGLQQEFESGVYQCCQIAEWATEQWEAWTEAAIEDAEVVKGREALLSAADSGLKRFLERCGTEIPNWDAVV